jgi:hypothetical protein
MRYALEIVKSNQQSKATMKIAQANFIQSHARNLVEVEKFEYLFTKVFKRLIMITKNDFFQFSQDKMSKFLWRNFTVYVGYFNLVESKRWSTI